MSDGTSPAAGDVKPGDKIAGYRLEEQIGQGGMAVVFRARDERLDRRVALKLLAPRLAADAAFRTRFIRESRAAAAVDHPNIIPVYDAGDAGGFLFIAMRYVQGGDVRSLYSSGAALPAAQVWDIISQVAAALDAAHAHELIHRDVKPANMLLDAGGATSANHQNQGHRQRDHVYLSDFGISKHALASHLTSTGQFLGTLDYIAPEQIEGQAVDGRADQYSLACAAFELLCGEPPFRREHGLALINAHLSEPPPAVVARRQELPAAVDLVLAKAMAKKPAQRYPTCAQFAADLGRALGLVPGRPQAAGYGPAAPGAGSNDRAMPWPATELAGPGQQHTNRFGQSPAGAPTSASPGPLPQQQRPGPDGFGNPGGVGSRDGSGNPGGFGSPAPGWPQYSPPPGRRSHGTLISVLVAALAVAAAAVTTAVVLTSHDKNNTNSGSTLSPPPSSLAPATVSSAARAQAAQLSKLLGTSVQSHGALQTAVLDIEDNCTSLSASQFSADVAAIQSADNQRQTEYNQAQGLDTSALRSGAALKSDLMTALFASLQADNNYLSWAQQEQSGCFVSSQSSAYAAANAHSSRASAAKSDFASLWNPIAPSYGQSAVSPGDI
ncbi:MAG TPA: protein kinase [Streptosporangiaceae bacterium]|nr:protein kinase [Streptosporangiaceae bacterium]